MHGAHLYLLSQFISPLTNLRTDRYGGDLAGRAAFPLEVVRSIRERTGPGFGILFRINSVELIDGGMSVEEGMLLARQLEG